MIPGSDLVTQVLEGGWCLVCLLEVQALYLFAHLEASLVEAVVFQKSHGTE